MESTLTQLTASLKSAHCELSINLTEKETLVKLARKLDAIQSDLDSFRTFIEAERAGLKELKAKFNLGSTKRKGDTIDKGHSVVDKVHSVVDKGHIIEDIFAHIAHIDQNEFDSIPKYSRGRIPLIKINSLIDHLNRFLHDKYTLILRSNPSKLSIDQRQRISEWRASESDETTNRFFLTEADLKIKSAAGGSFKFDQVARNVLTILRLVGRIKESRSAGIIRYIFQ